MIFVPLEVNKEISEAYYLGRVITSLIEFWSILALSMH